MSTDLFAIALAIVAFAVPSLPAAVPSTFIRRFLPPSSRLWGVIMTGLFGLAFALYLSGVILSVYVNRDVLHYDGITGMIFAAVMTVAVFVHFPFTFGAHVFRTVVVPYYEGRVLRSQRKVA